MTKKCFKCGTEQPLEQFYRHPMMADGHLGKCKRCTRLDVRKNRAAKKEYYDEYDRRRYREGRHLPTRDPIKVKATAAVNIRVKRGTMKKPTTCSECGATDRKIEGHHDDYSRPLDVRWLCTVCHDAVHSHEGKL